MSHTSVTGARTARRPVHLRIIGANLLLNGRFDNWHSTMTMGADLDQAAVRLVVDATSPRRPRAPGEPATDVFSFESTKVRGVGVGAYEADGVLEAASGHCESLTVLIESPPAHTAFFALSFLAKREDLGDGWHELIDPSSAGTTGAVAGASDSDAGEHEMNARAWLRTPILAAA